MLMAMHIDHPRFEHSSSFSTQVLAVLFDKTNQPIGNFIVKIME